MRVPLWLLTLLVASAILASGCAGGAQKGASVAPTPTSSVVATGSGFEGTASISGVVVDDEARPVVGATAGILEPSLSVTTGQQGDFSIQNLAAGTYKLVAQKLGYESVAKAVTVADGQALKVSLLLTPLPVDQAYPETIGPRTQFMTCGLSTTGLPVLLGSSTGPCNYGAGGVAPFETAFGKSNNSIKFKAHEANIDAVVGETRWTPSAVGTSNRLLTSFSYSGRSSTHWWCASAGPSPTRWVWSTDPEKLVCANKGSSTAEPMPTKKLDLVVFSNPDFVYIGNTANPRAADVALGQSFESVITLFYGMQAPDQFTAFPDR